MPYSWLKMTSPSTRPKTPINKQTNKQKRRPRCSLARSVPYRTVLWHAVSICSVAWRGMTCRSQCTGPVRSSPPGTAQGRFGPPCCRYNKTGRWPLASRQRRRVLPVPSRLFLSCHIIFSVLSCPVLLCSALSVLSLSLSCPVLSAGTTP